MRAELLRLLTQAQTCLQNNEWMDEDQSARQSIQILLEDIEKLSSAIESLTGGWLSEDKLARYLGDSERNQRFRRVSKGECL